MFVKERTISHNNTFIYFYFFSAALNDFKQAFQILNIELFKLNAQYKYVIKEIKCKYKNILRVSL